MVIRGLKIPLRDYIIYFYLQNMTEYILYKFCFYMVAFLLLVALTFISYLCFNFALHSFSYLFHLGQVYFLSLVFLWGIETELVSVG